MNGFHGRILKINLTTKQFEIDELNEKIARQYLGGKGLASWLLATLNPPKVDPLSPENHLIFATGPVAGENVWGSSRYGVFTKSPLTGFYAESYSGGKVAEAMDATGFDAIVLSGAFPQPSMMIVEPEGVTFQSADEFWGMDSYEALEKIKTRYKNSFKGRQGAVVIGPAGENRIPFAVIQNDKWHFAGRTGVGAIMGAKYVKSIVFRGNRKKTLADPARIKEISKKLARESKDNPGVKAYKSMGTSMMVDLTNAAGCFPAKYWSQGSVDHCENINTAALHSRCKVVPEACAKCFMACGRNSRVLDGPYTGLRLKGPEYETIYVFGGLCMVENIEEILYLNDLCNRLGLDTITTGNLCAFTIEAAKAGKVTYPIDYNDVDGIAQLVQEMATGTGEVGTILSKGIKYAAATWDFENRAVHVKGLEPAGFDPRVLKGMGLAYAVSDRGACHLRTTFYKPELTGLIPPKQIEDKAELLIDYEDRLTLFDTLILCRFFRDIYDWELLEQLIEAATGLPSDKPALRQMAAAVTDLVRKFNLREGLKEEDDDLPPGIYDHELDGNHSITRDELHQMRSDYYHLRQWGADGRLVSD